MLPKLYFLLLLLVHIIRCEQFEKIELNGIRRLKFSHNRTTVGPHPVQQLKCINDPNEPLCVQPYEPLNVTCINGNYRTYFDAADWQCKEKHLYPEIKFKWIRVDCEPFENSTSFVIKDSCHLSFTLKWAFHDNHRGVTFWETMAIIFFVVLVCVVLFVAFSSSLIDYETRPRQPINSISAQLRHGFGKPANGYSQLK